MHKQDDERLIHDHAELGVLLGQLIAALESNDAAPIHATLDLFWARLAMHIRAEHLHLFPTILHAVRRNPGGAPTPEEAEKSIELLREDHNFFMRELSQAVAVTRELLANPETDPAEQLQTVRQSINAVQQRLVKHNELEEKGIYLWTRTLLTQAEQSDLAAAVNRELENTPPRFAEGCGNTADS